MSIKDDSSRIEEEERKRKVVKRKNFTSSHSTALGC
jgi:hypothetical protein